MTISKPAKILFFLVVLLAAGCGRPRAVRTFAIPSAPTAREHDDDPFGAAQYFLEQRVPAGGVLPVERYLAAQRHTRSMRRFSLRQNKFSDSVPHDVAASFGTWESLGPGNVGGRTRGLVVHPNDSNTMWVGAATGGVWKTTDGGNSWTPTTDFAPVLSINSLVIDPSNPDTLYAGTGEQTQNWRGAGIFKTTDGGATWNQLTATNTPDFYFVNNVAVSRAAPSHLYAATNTGLWASMDGGATWNLSLASPDGGPAPTLTGGTTNGCFDVAVQPGQATDVVFAVCHPAGSLAYAVFRNTDAAGAGTWSMVLSDPLMWYTALAVAPSQPSTVYAMSVTMDTGRYAKALLAVYRSTANGDAGTWETRTSNQDSNHANSGILSVDAAYSFGSAFCTGSPNFNGQGGYNLALLVDPLDADRIWGAGVGIFRSDDGGANWGYAFYGNHPDQHYLAFDSAFNGTSNQVLYNVNDGGIYKTQQARGKTATCSSLTTSITWQTLNNGYGVTQFYHGTPYPGGDAYVGGTQDNETVRGGDALGPNQWDYIYGGDGGVSRMDPVNAATLFVEYVHGAMAKSTDGGNTYVNATTGITEDSNNFPFIAYYVFDPANSLRLWVGGAQLWRTEDGAAHWKAASAPIDHVNGALDNVRALAVSPADSNLVLFGMSHGRIFRNASALSATGTTRWDSTQPRSGNVSHIEFDPRQPSTIYATYTTFNSAPGDQHVYRSTDAGLTWTGIDGTGPNGLPDVPVETLLVDPDDSSRLYIGTDLGVYASLDGGQTWVRDDNPFANAITTTLTIVRNGGVKYLFAFTYGRGVWRVPLSDDGSGACQYSISPSTLTADATGGTFTAAVSTSPGCSWSATPAVTDPNAFAAVQGPASGSGNGTVFLTVSPNVTTSARSTRLLVGDQQLTVNQPGASSIGVGDELAGAYNIASIPFQALAPNSLLGQNSSDPRHSCSGSANFHTGWLRFTALADGLVQVTLRGVSSAAPQGSSGVVLAVYSLSGGTLGPELGCAVAPKTTVGAQTAAATLPVSNGQVYAVEIASLSTSSPLDVGTMYIGVSTAQPAPTLTISPSQVSLQPGATQLFQAVSSNLPNGAVRWTVAPQIGAIASDGTYTSPSTAVPGTVTITAQSLSNPSLSSVATVTIAIPPPSLGPTATANAASLQTGSVAPGEAVVIYGDGIGPSALVTGQPDANGNPPTILGGTEVLFDGVAARLLFAGSQAVGAIVPNQVAGKTATQMVVAYSGASTTPAQLTVAAASPALFTADSSGAGQIKALNPDGSANGPANGAAAGSVITVFANGVSQTTGIGVKIGGIDTAVAFGNGSNAAAGVLQLVVTIPPSTPSGPASIVLTAGGNASRPDTTIAVQ